jgi:cardiolipin synthase A/B
VTTGNDVFGRLAELAVAIADAFVLERVCWALENGRLTLGSTAVTRADVAAGSAKAETLLRALQVEWNTALPALSGPLLALLLRTSAASVAAVRGEIASTEVVWTGPKVEGSFLRATREVVRELLRGAKAELLVVGYWIAAREDGEGIIEEVIASLSDAVRRRVSVNVVVDERIRPDGRDNRTVLISAWPTTIPLPKVSTWRLPPNDQHLKLHAKVIVADRRDALITSANLTSYAMNRNMEMGVRVAGRPAQDIARHFDLLEASGVVQSYEESRGHP